MNKFSSLSCMAIGAMFLSAFAASAQQISSVAQSNSWVVYIDDANSKHCYISAEPEASRALRDGKSVEVNRGNISLYVGVKNGVTEPSFLAGYPLSNDKSVELKIGSQVFNYFTNPNSNAEYAWSQPKFDSQIINAMKAGSKVTVTGQSQRGTTTVDDFSLSGFTAAYNAALERCR